MAWVPNKARWAARAKEQEAREAEQRRQEAVREAERGKQEAAQAANLLVTSIVVRIFVRAACHARHPMYIHEGADWRSRAQLTLKTVAKRALITSQDCIARVSVFSAQGEALCPDAVLNGNIAHDAFPFRMLIKPSSLLRPRFEQHPHEVPVECVPLGTIESWPKSQKIKGKQVMARGLTCLVQARLRLDIIRSTFRGWQLTWHFSRRTLSELARDIDADLSSQMCQSDLRRAATWPYRACGELAGLHRTAAFHSSARSKPAAPKPRRKLTLRELASEIDAAIASPTHQSDLRHTATWPSGARSQPAAAKPRRKRAKKNCRS